MRAAQVVVPVAALAALLTRWPDLWTGIAATVFAGLWTATVWMRTTRPRLESLAPLWAILLLLVPVAATPLVPVPSILVGLLVAAGVIALLPDRSITNRRTALRISTWIPAALVAALLLGIPALTALAGPDRWTTLADRFAPASLAFAALLMVAATAAFHFITHRDEEVPA